MGIRSALALLIGFVLALANTSTDRQSTRAMRVSDIALVSHGCRRLQRQAPMVGTV